MSAARKKREKSTANSIIELVIIIAIAAGLALGIQAFLIKPYKIPSESMLPTLQVGQRVLVNRLGTHFGDPEVGDITVFHPPREAEEADETLQCRVEHPSNQGCPTAGSGKADVNYIKRVVGVPGDHLTVRDGHVIRNGKPESDSYIAPCGDSDKCNLSKPVIVPKNQYYMMGDNRGFSDDSRFWGPVPKDWIIGEAFATYWPLDRIGLL